MQELFRPDDNTTIATGKDTRLKEEPLGLLQTDVPNEQQLVPPGFLRRPLRKLSAVGCWIATGPVYIRFLGAVIIKLSATVRPHVMPHISSTLYVSLNYAQH